VGGDCQHRAADLGGSASAPYITVRYLRCAPQPS
jgi:hypothetical protein